MPKRMLVAVALALFVPCVVALIDYLLFNKSLMPNSGPEVSVYGFSKSALAIGLSAILLGSILHDGKDARSLNDDHIAGVGFVLATHLIAVGFVILFLVDAVAFNRLGAEDHVVEYLTAAFMLVGAGYFAQAFLSVRRADRRTPQLRLAYFAAPACALLLFFLAMEEISWMQRIIGWETPDAFAANGHGETNLHNFFTRPLNIAFRLVAWGAFILLPFILAFGPKFPFEPECQDFLPARWFAALAAPLAAFNYNAWPFLQTQIIAYTSIAIMIFFAHDAYRRSCRSEAGIFAAAAAVIIVAQSAFLLKGASFVRHYDVSEYQEFLVGVVLAVFAWFVRSNVLARKRYIEQRVPGLKAAATVPAPLAGSASSIT